MVDQIKEKAKNIRESNEKNFENNVRVFDRKATQQVQHIFRDTNYEQRRRERLGKWKDNKYSKKIFL